MAYAAIGDFDHNIIRPRVTAFDAERFQRTIGGGRAVSFCDHDVDVSGQGKELP